MDIPLDPPAILAALPEWEIHFLGVTTSTNDIAKSQAALGGRKLTAFLADAQTAGRGRRGATWVSPPGRNIIVSTLINAGPGLPPERWTRLTLAAALACCDVLDPTPGLAAVPEIKWPNDIYLSGKKVAGILVESIWGADGGAVVIGAGINLNLQPMEFPSELRETATSVWIERGGLVSDRSAWIVRYLKALEMRVAQTQSDFGQMTAEAWQRSYLANRRVTLTSAGVQMEGTVVGLGPEGELMLCSDNGTVTPVSSADWVRPVGSPIR